jgi:hypothetical protein
MFDPTVCQTVLLKSDIFPTPVHPDGLEQKWRGQWRLVKLSKAKGAQLNHSGTGSNWLLGKAGKLKGCLHIQQTTHGGMKYNLRYYNSLPFDTLRGKGEAFFHSSEVEKEEIGQILRCIESYFRTEEFDGVDPGSCPVCKTTYNSECPNCGVGHY